MASKIAKLVAKIAQDSLQEPPTRRPRHQKTTKSDGGLVVFTLLHFLQRSPTRPPNVAKIAPRVASRWPPKPHLGAILAPSWRQLGQKGRPKTSQDRPKISPRCPSTGPRRPKTPQDRPKIAPRCPSTGPRRPKTPKEHLKAAKSMILEGFWGRFCDDFWPFFGIFVRTSCQQITNFMSKSLRKFVPFSRSFRSMPSQV